MDRQSSGGTNFAGAPGMELKCREGWICDGTEVIDRPRPLGRRVRLGTRQKRTSMEKWFLTGERLRVDLRRPSGRDDRRQCVDLVGQTVGQNRLQ